VGQKVHPNGFRLGIYEDWKARWFAKKSYGKALIEDIKLRQYLRNRLSKTDVAKIEIEKAVDNIRVIIHASRPGIIIGKKGQGIDRLREALRVEFGKNVDVSVQEVRKPEMSAQLVAEGIAEQLVKRASYKRLMKRSGFSAMKAGAKGIKICCSGRLSGAEIARTEWVRLGSVPLHTLRSNVQYALAEAKTTYGIIGVKVWICKGEYL